MNRQPRVALFLESSLAYGRGVLKGVSEYIREHRPWDLYFVAGMSEDPAPLARWRGDGIIARPRSHAAQLAVARLECARVVFDLNPTVEEAKGAAGIGDSKEIAAEMAFTHFRERGYRHFAFVLFPNGRGHQLDEPFTRRVEAEGFRCEMYRPTDPAVVSGDEFVQQRDLAEWLKGLPRPCAVWAANDWRGLAVLDACRSAGLRVPEDMAVLGHTNDLLVCELCTPTLSSVAVPYEKMGYDAAAMLDRMMAGEAAPETQVLYPPSGIVTRRSTDIVAVEDADLADALRFIRDHAVEGIGVEDVVAAASLSRSTLQRRFQAVLGRTPADEIERVRINRCKELLAYTDLSVRTIAGRSGYANAPRLAEAFRRVTGGSPMTYRKRLNPKFGGRVQE